MIKKLIENRRRLVTNGCSMTWGSGLNPETRVVDAYPYKLAKLLDAELFNLSNPGVSCHYVARTTIDFFLDRLEEDLSDYIVILQLPAGHRFEYWDTDIKKWKPKIMGHHDRSDVNLVEYFGSMEWDFYNVTDSVLQVGNFLKENNIRYYISNGGENWDDIMDPFYIKRKKYIETNYSILGGFFTNSRLDGGKQGEEVLISREDPHWNEYGHTVVANNIYRFLNNE